MASIELYNDAPAVSKFAYAVVQRVETNMATFTRWNLARKTRAELYKLSLRELDDIGIAYGDIKKIR